MVLFLSSEEKGDNKGSPFCRHYLKSRRDARPCVSTTIRGFVETRCLASLCGKIPVYLGFST
ncbi:MAG: hypothetical protein VSS75_012620 [Candidatus Parabeggiatoa sp.]|nr:hypothetical protein [Candidatus Parabeggiatoa sp.]